MPFLPATCWIGWIRPRVLRRLVGWPPGVRPVAVLTVGYAAEPAAGRPRPAERRPAAEWVTRVEAP